MVMMTAAGRLGGRMPFERLWMYHYIDRQMEVDNSHSRARLEWTPSARYQVERRLPFLIERFKSESVEWHARNAAVMRKEIIRPDLAILKALVTEENQFIDALAQRVGEEAARGRLPSYGAMEASKLVWLARLWHRLLVTSVQTSNRMLLVNYLEVTGVSRFKTGFSVDEVCLFLRVMNDVIVEALRRRADLRRFEHELFDRVTVPIELAMEEVRGQYERLQERGETVPEDDLEGAGPEGATAREMIESTIWSCLVQRR